MNEWGLIDQDTFVGIAPKGSLSGESSPQFLDLNQGMATSPSRSFSGARCARREVSAPEASGLIPTHHSWALWAIESGLRAYGNHLLEQKRRAYIQVTGIQTRLTDALKTGNSNSDYLFIPGIQYIESFSTYIREFRTSKGRPLR